MSLTIPYPARRRAKGIQHPTRTSALPPSVIVPAGAAVDQVWHVGLSQAGQFPFREANCACPKAACGLVVPDPTVECDLHTQSAHFLQVHSAADCDFPRTGWRRKRRHNLR